LKGFWEQDPPSREGSFSLQRFPRYPGPRVSIRRYGKRLLAENRGYHGWWRPG